MSETMRPHSDAENAKGESSEWHFAQGPTKIFRPVCKSVIFALPPPKAASCGVTTGGGVVHPDKRATDNTVVVTHPEERIRSDLRFWGPVGRFWGVVVVTL